MSTVPVNFDGIEIDMLSLGDADCIILTRWYNSLPNRVLIDGGSGGDFAEIADFLRKSGYTEFWAVICSHCHEDHAAGLIKLIESKKFNFYNAWMHDIRNHVEAGALKRASAADDGVAQVVETTTKLALAFRSRSIVPSEPFAGAVIAGLPNLFVIGPTRAYYERVIAEFTDVPLAVPRGLDSVLFRGQPSPWSTLLSAPLPTTSAFSALLGSGSTKSPFTNLLSGSSVQEEPKTQPFNNSSTILGMRFTDFKYMFTADAGSEALDQVPEPWSNVEWMQIPHHGSDGNLSQENIERFCPRISFVSATGDASHPSRAIVNGLIKVGSTAFSTHENGHLRHWRGCVPYRAGYVTAEPLKATGGMQIPPLPLRLR